MSTPTVPLIDQKGSDAENSTVSYLRDIEDRIVHLLTIYPKISPSMLQIGIGSSLPPKIWRPVLQSLVDRNLVVQEVLVNISPKGRNQSHQIISLVEASSTLVSGQSLGTVNPSDKVKQD